MQQAVDDLQRKQIEKNNSDILFKSGDENYYIEPFQIDNSEIKKEINILKTKLNIIEQPEPDQNTNKHICVTTNMNEHDIFNELETYTNDKSLPLFYIEGNSLLSLTDLLNKFEMPVFDVISSQHKSIDDDFKFKMGNQDYQRMGHIDQSTLTPWEKVISNKITELKKREKQIEEKNVIDKIFCDVFNNYRLPLKTRHHQFKNFELLLITQTIFDLFDYKKRIPDEEIQEQIDGLKPNFDEYTLKTHPTNKCENYECNICKISNYLLQNYVNKTETDNSDYLDIIHVYLTVFK